MMENGDSKFTITSVKVRPYNGDSTDIVAFASITIDDAFMVHNLRILRGRDGLFVVMPREQGGYDPYDIAHPINTPTRTYLQACVLDGWEQYLASQDPCPTK